MDTIKETPRFHKIGSSKNNLIVVVKKMLLNLVKKLIQVKMFQNLREKAKVVIIQKLKKGVNL